MFPISDQQSCDVNETYIKFVIRFLSPPKKKIYRHLKDGRNVARKLKIFYGVIIEVLSMRNC